jgi:hypothetical protein
MAGKARTGSRRGTLREGPDQPGRTIGPVVQSAIARGFVIGREVLIGSIPGIVVGYNIASFGQFVGNTYPLVVRTALGVTKCGVDEVSLV